MPFHTRATALWLHSLGSCPCAGCIAVVLTHNGLASQLISKYRPPCPVIVISDQDWVLRQANISYGLYPFKVESVSLSNVRKTVEDAIKYAWCGTKCAWLKGTLH